MNCNFCGFETPDGALFCPNCGKKLAPAPSPMVSMPVTPAPMVEPVVEPAPAPVIEPVVEPAPAPVFEPVVEPVFNPVFNPVFEPAVEAVAEPTPAPVVEPVVEPAPAPVIEPVVEPAPAPVVEPVVEPAPAPVFEPVVEPVVEATPVVAAPFAPSESTNGSTEFDPSSFNPTAEPASFNQPDNSYNFGQTNVNNINSQPADSYNFGQANVNNANSQPTNSYNFGQTNVNNANSQPANSYNFGQTNVNNQFAANNNVNNRNAAPSNSPVNGGTNGYQYNYAKPSPAATKSNETKSGLSICSFILGIFGVICCPLGFLVGLVGLILGIASRSKKQGKKGLAVTGIILNSIAIIIGLIIGIYCIITMVPDANFSFLSLGQSSIEETDFKVNDGSYLSFEENDYTWSAGKKDKDNYITGSYTAYYDDNAFDYLEISIPEYGLSRESIENFCSNQTDDLYSPENLVVLVMTINERCIDGVSSTENPPLDVYYYGFYDGKNFDGANMDTQSSVVFTKD